MTRRSRADMRSYWDERAQLNAAWFVDTTLDYEQPDMERFFKVGEEIAAYALDRSPRPPERYQTALEIGSGLGRVSRALTKTFKSVVGIDVSAEMLRRGRGLVPDPQVLFVQGDGSGLSAVRDESVDFVLTFTVFQHIPRVRVIEEYIREMGRVLRPGGVCAFQWNNEAGSIRWTIRRRALSLLPLGWRGGRHGTHAPQFLGSRVSTRRIRAATEAAGLRISKTEELGTLFAWAWAERARDAPLLPDR